MTDEPKPDAPITAQSPDASPSGEPPASPQPRRRGFDPRMAKLVLLYVAICLGVPLFLFVALHHWVSTSISELSIHSALPFELIQAFSVMLATYVVARVDRRSMGDFGIPPRQAFGARFWEGAVWGFAMLSLVVFVQHSLGMFRLTGIALSGPAALKYAVAWALVFLMVGMYEEGFFRGFFLFALARRLSFWPAALILSVAFAAAHLGNHGENFFGILQVFVIGMVFCFTIRRTGSLWFAIGLHMAWDWAQTFFYGTPDSGLIGVGHFFNSTASGPRWLSGGSAGPEGSVLAFAVILLAAAFIHFRFPKALYPDRPA